jgi:hypothetical protein
MSLANVVADPAKARALFASADGIEISLVRQLGTQERGLGHQILTIWNDPPRYACREQMRIYAYGDCLRFNALAQHPPGLDEDGYIFEPETHRSPRTWTYIVPASERLSATGDAIYIQCGVLGFCQVTEGPTKGYAIRPRVFLHYQLQLDFKPKSSWRATDARLREIIGSIVITDQR